MLNHDIVIKKFLEKLIQYKVKNIVFSPGSRSTPLVNNILINKKYFNTKIILDERSAAFFALGVSKASGKPTVLICTSGTSTLNYAPAIAEAFYSRIPLIVITADRPMQFRETNINQTLNQSNIYTNNINWFYDIPVATSNNSNFISNIAYKSVLKSSSSPKGPVHINWQFDEPFTDGKIKTIDKLEEETINDDLSIKLNSIKDNFLNKVENKNGIILVGQNENNTEDIIRLANKLNWPIIADPLSNLRIKNNYNKSTIIDTGDLIFRTNKIYDIETVIHIGSLPVSKYIANSLLKAKFHIFFEESKSINEGLFNIDLQIQGNLKDFIAIFELKKIKSKENNWNKKFSNINKSIRKTFDSNADEIEEIKFKKILLNNIPESSVFISGNSLPIRILDIVLHKSKLINFVANRGLSGIDGNIAIASGFSSILENPVYLDIGDLAFLHDSSSLITAIRNSKNLTIIVNNNHGGQIFNLLPQAKDLKNIYNKWFITAHDEFSIKNIVKGFGCNYYSPENQNDFKDILISTAKTKGTKVIELNFSNTDYSKFNIYIKNITKNL